METMTEKIQEFMKPGCGANENSGEGEGWGWGSGDGDGEGWGNGSGEGSGLGWGWGWGWGWGSGSGSGWGSGDGSGNGSGVKNISGQTVYFVDSLPTLIDHVHGYIAKGRILNVDLTLTPCYIVKGNGYFAHGSTIHKAMEALEEKILDNMPVEEKIDQFLEKFHPEKEYPARDFYNWHHTLTGSCEMGRREFAKDHQIDVENDRMTPEQFMDLTKDAYGGSVIRQLMDAWKEKYYDAEDERR